VTCARILYQGCFVSSGKKAGKNQEDKEAIVGIAYGKSRASMRASSCFVALAVISRLYENRGLSCSLHSIRRFPVILFFPLFPASTE